MHDARTNPLPDVRGGSLEIETHAVEAEFVIEAGQGAGLADFFMEPERERIFDDFTPARAAFDEE
jgi:hypothetical protein